MLQVVDDVDVSVVTLDIVVLVLVQVLHIVVSEVWDVWLETLVVLDVWVDVLEVLDVCVV